MKPIHADQSVYEICSQYPEIKPILAEIGFTQLLNPIQFQTVARIMTLRKGSILRQIDLQVIKTKLQEHGYELEV